ncbi:eukaryotic and archaeal DNA primase, large subunit-domain-containing protein [Chaetomium tenue]|uniref:Eukaryotic and archaeal DNA primase, large subunit-domain-containing protein n=1 Tax=Chaetomium tenue TaxID=1854479 RepID=A0ACB7PIN3_9PEZI|nr:eukaryotic and archaeal DNA primase, large subunit-domain-containing protein [Chaetomium globosum]
MNRIDVKKRVLDHRKKQFAGPLYKETQYPHRLNFYATPPTADITLEQFEQWAINRLRVLAELEACSFRNKTLAETALHMKPLLEKYLPLDASSSNSSVLHLQRQQDHYSHFILRLAFASTEDLRRRFARVETMLFRLRFQTDDSRERAAFVSKLNLDWEPVSDEEKRELAPRLATTVGFGYGKRAQQVLDEDWCKVDWTRVPDLVEGRKVFVKAGMAYVPGREQQSMVLNAFSKRLGQALELTARALPRLDEDDRLAPILDHLSKNFTTPDASYTGSGAAIEGAEITARNMDNLSQHFPMCMNHLHRSLRRDAHLKHFGRLQYTLFLKGIGLNLEECLIFWRSGFSKITDDTFNKNYRYNVRHVYGDVGGDSNRRGGGYSPYSCQKILTEHAPGPGEAHGCPYRHFSLDNLTSLLRASGVADNTVLKGVKEDKESQKFHMACNRVFEHIHKREIKRAKEEGIMTAAQLETIVHPNEYFKRSYLLKNMDGKPKQEKADVKMEG